MHRSSPNLGRIRPSSTNSGPKLTNVGPQLTKFGPHLTKLGPTLANFGRNWPTLILTWPNASTNSPILDGLGQLRPNSTLLGRFRLRMLLDDKTFRVVQQLPCSSRVFVSLSFSAPWRRRCVAIRPLARHTLVRMLVSRPWKLARLVSATPVVQREVRNCPKSASRGTRAKPMRLRHSAKFRCLSATCRPFLVELGNLPQSIGEFWPKFGSVGPNRANA